MATVPTRVGQPARAQLDAQRAVADLQRAAGDTGGISVPGSLVVELGQALVLAASAHDQCAREHRLAARRSRDQYAANRERGRALAEQRHAANCFELLRRLRDAATAAGARVPKMLADTLDVLAASFDDDERDSEALRGDIADVLDVWRALKVAQQAPPRDPSRGHPYGCGPGCPTCDAHDQAHGDGGAVA